MTPAPQIDWATAIRYANLIRLAETVLPTGDDDQLRSQLAAQSYQYVATLCANELATDHDPHVGEVDSFGCLAISPDQELVAVIRGTDTILEWMHDFEFLRVAPPVPGCQGETEDGFSALYASLRTSDSGISAVAAIRQQLEAGAVTSVTICGHSLGGALATLLAIDIALNTSCKNLTSYTFGSPQVGDHTFVAGYDATVPFTFRVANRHDLIPHMPTSFPIPYTQVATLFEIAPPPGKVKSSIACMHHLTTYIWLMGQVSNQSSGPLDADCAL